MTRAPLQRDSDQAVSPGARALGSVLSGAFDLLARARRGKPIHSRGVVAEAVITRSGGLPVHWGVPWLDDPGTDIGLARLSRSVGLPGPLPDVLGLAIQFRTSTARHDLLLATTGLRPILRHVLVMGRRPLRSAYTSLLPYDGAGQRLLLAAVPDRDAPRAVTVHDVAHALVEQPCTFDLLVATLSGPWQPFGTLRLHRGADSDDPDAALALDPVLHPLPGMRLADPFRDLREPSYQAARRARSTR